MGVIGKPGNGPLEFMKPTDVAIGKDNRLYVAEFGNHRSK